MCVGGACWESQHCSSIQSWCSMLRQTGGCGGKEQCSSDRGFCPWWKGRWRNWRSQETSCLTRGRQQPPAGVWKKVAEPCAGRAWGLGRASGSTCRGSADASGQTSVSPVWLFLHWLLEDIIKHNCRTRATSPCSPHSFFCSHLTNKKSLNSWWSVNTGGEGRGGPNSGTLSSENIFNLHITRNNTVTLTWRRFRPQKVNRESGERGCMCSPVAVILAVIPN